VLNIGPVTVNCDSRQIAEKLLRRLLKKQNKQQDAVISLDVIFINWIAYWSYEPYTWYMNKNENYYQTKHQQTLTRKITQPTFIHVRENFSASNQMLYHEHVIPYWWRLNRENYWPFIISQFIREKSRNKIAANKVGLQ
jgi:hypothetical protein